MKIRISEVNTPGRKYFYLTPTNEADRTFLDRLATSGLPQHRGGFYTGRDRILLWDIQRSSDGKIGELALVFRP